MSIHAGLWQKRSDQAPVFNVIAMKDNEDEQMNDTHINNCFNQTISEFVFLQTRCYWCSEDNVDPHSIHHPLRVWLRLTDFRLWTLVTSLTLIARSWLGIFSAVRPSENWFLAKVPDSMPSLHGKACFTCLNWLMFLIFSSKQELSTLHSAKIVTSLRAWRNQRRSCGTTWCGPWGRPHIWVAFSTVNSCLPPLFRI